MYSKFEEVHLVYRNKTKAKDRPSAKSPIEAHEILRESWDMSQIEMLEESKILLLDNKLRLMSIALISKGGFSETIVDPRLVFSIALKRRASGIILAHNHPSGDAEPSASDIALTKKFVKAGKLLDIKVNDHLIITKDDYCSMIDGGHMNADFYLSQS